MAYGLFHNHMCYVGHIDSGTRRRQVEFIRFDV
jgi:hypothetical protein